MKMSSYASIKGASGVGKGSRFNQLIHFLRTEKEYDIKIVTMKEVDNGRKYAGAWRNHPVGMYCQELNLLVLAKYTKSPKSGLYSMTGLDAMDFDVSVALIGNLGQFNLLEESYVGSFSNDFAPDKLPQFSSFFYQSLTYDNFQQMVDRINQRSGPVPESSVREGRTRGDAAWGSNSLAKDFVKAVSSCKRINDIDLSVEDLPFDTPIYDFGFKYLNWLGLPELAVEFIAWSRFNSVHRHYEDLVSNHVQFKQLHDDQNEFCSAPNQDAHFVKTQVVGTILKRGKEIEGDIVVVLPAELSIKE